MIKGDIMKNKNINNEEFTYEIDYDIFTTDEIIKIIGFYQNVIKYQKHKISKNDLKVSYLLYKNTINSIALEKKYNKNFLEKTGISIYHLIRSLDD